MRALKGLAMKNYCLVSGLLVAFLISSVSAISQTGGPQNEQTPVGSRRINLTAEHGHVIKETVLKTGKVQSFPPDAKIIVGEAVPAAISTETFPPEVYEKVPPLKSHTFFINDDQVIIVDPKNNTIVDIVK